MFLIILSYIRVLLSLFPLLLYALCAEPMVLYYFVCYIVYCWLVIVLSLLSIFIGFSMSVVFILLNLINSIIIMLGIYYNELVLILGGIYLKIGIFGFNNWILGISKRLNWISIYIISILIKGIFNIIYVY